MPSANEIRQQFIDFFVKKHGHTFVPSSPVVPHDDPTLLFTNAGMNQFKPYFLGTAKPPWLRVANTQKCIRAGGKHNDLDDVGKDTYHHTFFEMLGNWSFGDYFKKEAIAWAWELLTEVWKLDKSRLHVTVFEGDPANNVPRDEEAAQHWRDVGVDEAHIHIGNKKDNFWEMGETGPCGPCTEIHYDKTPDKRGRSLVNKGTPDVIEIWNNVFIQFNRNPDKSLTPLPAKHVDTGMGFERITAVLQGKDSNYDTDVFTPIFEAIQKVTGAPKYTGELDDLKDTAYRVIADHIRTLTFALSDGARIGSAGRDYVLRRVLRRALRYGFLQLGMREPFLHKLVLTVVRLMGVQFPEVIKNGQIVERLILEEETGFLRTLENADLHFQFAAVDAITKALRNDLFPKSAHQHFEKDSNRLATTSLTAPAIDLKDENQVTLRRITLPSTVRELERFYSENCVETPVISGREAFDLHTTHGLLIDIVEQMATEAGIRVDRAGFDQEFAKFQDQSRKGQKKATVSAVVGDLPKTDDSPKYQGLSTSAQVLGWVEDNTVFSGGLVPHNRPLGLILDQTCFYAEQGGQVGDSGKIKSGTGDFVVTDTQRLGDTVLHIGELPEGLLEVGQKVEAQVDRPRRLDIMRNHTATHLLNLALRKVLGVHVEQKGSLVDQEKTRFDFAHDKPLSAEQVAEVEQIVNDQIDRDREVKAVVLPLDEAKKIPGVRAVFGEKYPDPVRVLLIGPRDPAKATENDSVEFCGGTHLHSTGRARLFKIVSQEAVGKGVRRLIGVTGRGAFASVQKLARVVGDLTERFHCSPDELSARVESLQDEVKKLQTQMRKGVSSDLAGAVDKLLADAPEMGGAKVVIGELPGGTMEQVRQQTDRLISKAGNCVIVLGWKEDDKVALRAVVTNDLTKKVHAGNLIKEVVAVVGGRGGGKPDKAEAGGPNADKLGDALALAKQRVTQMLGEPRP